MASLGVTFGKGALRPRLCLPAGEAAIAGHTAGRPGEVAARVLDELASRFFQAQVPEESESLLGATPAPSEGKRVNQLVLTRVLAHPLSGGLTSLILNAPPPKV
jgi:hypothetical protein